MKVRQMGTDIAEKEGCPSRFVEAVVVKEKFKDGTVWHGLVSIFVLHRPAEEICYAWLDTDGKSLVTVLNRPPVESPASAVRAYIASRVIG
jgi:hypothetical protein